MLVLLHQKLVQRIFSMKSGSVSSYNGAKRAKFISIKSIASVCPKIAEKSSLQKFIGSMRWFIREKGLKIYTFSQSKRVRYPETASIESLQVEEDLNRVFLIIYVHETKEKD